MSFIFRFDANAIIGNGHLVRSLMLARELRLRGHSTHILSHPLPSSHAALLGDHVFHEITERHSEGLHEIKVIAETLTIDCLIIDSYTLDFKFEMQARSYVNHIMVIDDLGNRRHDCDLLLDQNISNAIQDNYIDLAEATLGKELIMHPFEFEEIEGETMDNPMGEKGEKLYQLVDKDTPEEKEHNRQIFELSHKLAEDEWDELWEIFKGQDTKQFNKEEDWYKQFNGSGLQGWWD